MNYTNQITNSEWEVMRIIWTLGHSTSKQITDLLGQKKAWQASTVKTLLRRLDQKGFVKIIKSGHANVYFPKVKEQVAADAAVLNIFNHICAMHAGRSLQDIIKQVPISKQNINVLIHELQQKQKTAPDKVPCNCLKDCHHQNKMEMETE